MNLDQLYMIISETTMPLRKGAPVVEHQVGVTDVFVMPHESEAPAGLDKLDLVFLTVGVDRAKAEAHKAELAALLKTYPHPERLAAGPSYIEVGAELGDQGMALQLFALGQVLGFWAVITPKTLKMPDDQALDLAGRGLIMISGFNPDQLSL